MQDKDLTGIFTRSIQETKAGRALPPKPVRTIDEICIDADNHKDDIQYLYNLWAEVVAVKKKHSLVNLWFMEEHIKGYMNAIPYDPQAIFRNGTK